MENIIAGPQDNRDVVTGFGRVDVRQSLVMVALAMGWPDGMAALLGVCHRGACLRR